MDIKITILVRETGQQLDIKINNEQRIKTTLQVLRENMPKQLGRTDIETVRIRETGRRVAPERTYAEEQIYTGTLLVLEGARRGT